MAAAATFTITNNLDRGTGSLRQAIFDANASAGANVITFNISGGGVQVITPSSVLPPITNQVTLDANTQPVYAGVPLIVLNGNGNGLFNGLTVAAPGCAIEGLVIGGFGRSSDRPKSGIVLLSASNTVIACYDGARVCDPQRLRWFRSVWNFRRQEVDATGCGSPSRAPGAGKTEDGGKG